MSQTYFRRALPLNAAHRHLSWATASTPQHYHQLRASTHPVMNITPEPRLWTANDIAAWAQLNPGTIRNMQSKHLLPEPVRIGRSVRWVPAEVIAHFCASKVAA